MDDEGGTAIVLYKNAAALAEAVAPADIPAATEALQKYADLVRDVLLDLCGYKEFQHLQFLESSNSYNAGDVSSPLAIAVGAPLKGEDGQLLGLASTKSVLDVYGILTAQQPLPTEVADKVGLDEEGKLAFNDETSSSVKTAMRLNEKLDIETRFAETLSEEEEEAVAEALGTQLPESGDLSPVHPEDVLLILSFFLAETAGAPVRSRKAGSSRPGVMQRGKDLVGNVLRAPRGVLRQIGKRANALQHNLWRLEDFAVASAKFTVRLARKSVRPLLVGFIVHKVLSTIDNSKALEVRMAKLPPAKAFDLYYREVLGDNYNEQMEQDMLDAIKEVDEGLITEDYKDEKRLLTAAMLRRLEVEEWDKERMKHFYLGSYGLGPWYFDMEERLHNPYFIGARAWNGPIEGWVGRNKTYHGDMPVSANAFLTKIDLIEKHLGRRLTPTQRRRIMEQETARPVDALLGDRGLFNGVLDKSKVEEYVAH